MSWKKETVLQIKKHVKLVYGAVAKRYLAGIYADMRQGNEKRSCYYEKRNNLQRKNEITRFQNYKKQSDDDGQERSIDNYVTEVYDRQIVQKKVADETGRAFFGILMRDKLNEKSDNQK